MGGMLSPAGRNTRVGIFSAENYPPFDRSWPMDIIQDLPLLNNSSGPLDENERSGKLEGSSQIAPESA